MHVINTDTRFVKGTFTHTNECFSRSHHGESDTPCHNIPLLFFFIFIILFSFILKLAYEIYDV